MTGACHGDDVPSGIARDHDPSNHPARTTLVLLAAALVSVLLASLVLNGDRSDGGEGSDVTLADLVGDRVAWEVRRLRERASWDWPGALRLDDVERNCVADGAEARPSLLLDESEVDQFGPEWEPMGILDLVEECTAWTSVGDLGVGPSSGSWLVPGMADAARTRVCREFTRPAVAESGWAGDEYGLVCGVEVDHYWTLSLVSMRFPDFSDREPAGVDAFIRDAAVA